MADDATQAGGQTDGYYGDEELSGDELDLSFLDEEDKEEKGDDKQSDKK